MDTQNFGWKVERVCIHTREFAQRERGSGVGGTFSNFLLSRETPFGGQTRVI
jgi:hypothetical protein